MMRSGYSPPYTMMSIAKTKKTLRVGSFASFIKLFERL